MSSDREDDIGFGKPPKYTRFKKGQSGNPKGRPRRKRAVEAPIDTQFDDTLRDLNDRKMAIKINGKEQKVSAFKAVAMKQHQAALSGSVTAQRDIMREKRQIDERDALRSAVAAEAAEEAAEGKKQDQRNLYDYLVRQHAEQTIVYEQANASGTDPDPRYPHPDDFIFDHAAKRATIHGPWGESSSLHFRRMEKQRDFHFVDHIVLERQRPKGSKFACALAASTMSCFNAMLPKRQQLLGDDLETRLFLLYLMPMRDLREWRAELDFWLKINPPPDLDKKAKREVNKTVNAAMQPYLKPIGFRSVAELEHHLEAECRIEGSAS